MWYRIMKKIWIWVEDTKIRKAVITDLVITILDENDDLIMKIVNPTLRTIQLIEKNIMKYGGKTVSKDNPFTYINGGTKDDGV